MEEYQLSHNEILQNISEKSKSNIKSVILTDGINDVGNLGMIFRIADALKIDKIYLYNLKPDFNYKLLKKKSRFTSEIVSFEIIKTFEEIQKLKENYFFVIIDKTNKSIDYSKYSYPEKDICFVFGSENYGVSPEIIKIGNISLHLPMFGKNTSINVATAASVVLYDYYRNVK